MNVAAGLWPDSLAPNAPGVKIDQGLDMATQTVTIGLSIQLGRDLRVSREVLMRPDAEERVEGMLRAELLVLQSQAIDALGLERWRDEHEHELEAKAKGERLELVRQLYSAVRNAPSLEAAQLILADELEARR